MKKKVLIVVAAFFLFTIPIYVKAEMTSYGFISRAAVTDDLTIDAGGWVWTWPSIVGGFGVNVTGELGNKFLDRLAVGAGLSYDHVNWTYYADSSWSDIGIAGYAKYMIFNSKEMKKKVEFLPVNVSVLGGVKFNLYSFKINGKKYGIGDDVTGTYYGYYDNFVVFNALFLVDYPLKYISDNDFLKNVTVTGYTGLLNSYFSGGVDFWYVPPKQKFSVKIGWIPLLGLSADIMFAM